MRLETGRACATAFLAAFAALFLQVLVHRMVSAKMLSDYAFLVISLTMLGFAAAGALLSYTQRTVLAHREASLTVVSALFALSALLASIAFYATETAAPALFTRPRFVSAFFGWIPFALAFAVPFACVAFMLGVLLARQGPRRSPRLLLRPARLGSRRPPRPPGHSAGSAWRRASCFSPGSSRSRPRGSWPRAPVWREPPRMPRWRPRWWWAPSGGNCSSCSRQRVHPWPKHAGPEEAGSRNTSAGIPSPASSSRASVLPIPAPAPTPPSSATTARSSPGSSAC